MKQLLHTRNILALLAGIAIVFVISLLVRGGNGGDDLLVTTTVERGDVAQLVSVSGVAEASDTAQLAFPVGGVVRSVNVSRGDEVAAGSVLLSLDNRTLAADRQDALASRARAIASRDELIAGPTDISRAATGESVNKAEAALATTLENEARKIENARRALLSGSLEAATTNGEEDAAPPTITGTYTCDTEGTYSLRVYRSAADSGYSYQLSGLEFDTGTAFTQQSSPLGDCGLRIQFDANSNYGNSNWEVQIPNTNGSAYTANVNAYQLAQTQAQSAITIAQQEVALAQANQSNTNAPAREESVRRANADIAAANARIARIDAQISERTITAPFAGVVTALDILPGETASTQPVITIIAERDFELTARIPEIDIGKVLVGQAAEIRFDAKADELLPATIQYIALEATEIDGVAYYEAALRLPQEPVWLRNGLNADIDIIVQQATDTLRVPKRFVQINGDEATVQLRRGEETASTTVRVELVGNDGFVAISGLQAGEEIIAP